MCYSLLSYLCDGEKQTPINYMKYSLFAPAKIDTTILLPASKSISNRALLINALIQNGNPIQNLSDCDDTQVMIKALTKGEEIIDILAAGTAMRFLTAYFSLTEGTHILTGTKRMQERPIQILVDALRQLGATIEYTQKEGYPPLKITGKPLKGGRITIKGNTSSQFLSALLLIAPYLEEGLTLTIEGELISRPYIDITLNVMKDFGALAQWKSPQVIRVEHQPYKKTEYTIESDWSAASYWYALVALTPEAKVILPNLYKNSYQGDHQGKELFSQLGVRTEYTDGAVVLTQCPIEVKSLQANFVEIPDLAQTFVVACCLLNIPFEFTGLQSLKIKETDRMEALIQEMKKLGYILHSQNNNTLLWRGERITPQGNPEIATYEDHRMAMSFAPAAQFFAGLTIKDPMVVTKSYPNFWNDLSTAGFRISKQE